MSKLDILEFPDPRLKLVATPVEKFDSELKSICANLIETMYSQDGVGLAATQVAIQKRVFVMDISDSRDQPTCLINPEIINAEGELIWEEGCLSFPGVYAKVKRSNSLTVKYYDQEGNTHEETVSGLHAVCIQHEIDHLNGITFFDHLSKLKQNMIRKKLNKIRERET